MEYARTMSSIIFRQRSDTHAASMEATTLSHAPAPAGDLILAGFTPPPPPVKKAVAELAAVEIAQHEYLEQKRGFAFHTFLSKREIIACTHKVRAECNKVLGLTLLTMLIVLAVRVARGDVPDSIKSKEAGQGVLPIVYTWPLRTGFVVFLLLMAATYLRLWCARARVEPSATAHGPHFSVRAAASTARSPHATGLSTTRTKCASAVSSSTRWWRIR